jgi:hypothetical protein
LFYQILFEKKNIFIDRSETLFKKILLILKDKNILKEFDESEIEFDIVLNELNYYGLKGYFKNELNDKFNLNYLSIFDKLYFYQNEFRYYPLINIFLIFLILLIYLYFIKINFF